MRRSEGVVDINIGESRQPFREGGIVCLLFRMEADIFKHRDLPVRHFRDGGFNLFPHTVVQLDDTVAQEFLQPFRNRIHPQTLRDPFGPSQMGDEQNLRAPVAQVADGGQGRSDSHIVRDVPLLVHRNIEIDPNQNPLPPEFIVPQIRNAFFHLHTLPNSPVSGNQRLLATSFTRSIIRQEKPHSLSYQERTLIRLPSRTMVDFPSTIEECGLPR